jgi:DNA-binding IclR family transcriptional regulator
VQEALTSEVSDGDARRARFARPEKPAPGPQGSARQSSDGGKLSLTVLNAIDVIEVLASADTPVPLAAIVAKVGLSTTATHRLLASLRSRGLAIQDPVSKRYSLGWKMVTYGNRVLSSLPFSGIVMPWLEQLRDLTGETATLHVPDGDHRVCVLECESKSDIRRSVGVGRRVPIHKGASGRAILAFLPDQEQAKILSGLSAPESHAVEPLLAATRDSGYAISHEESTRSVAALAVPVFDSADRVVGALSVSGPSFRWTDKEMLPFVPDLLRAADQIRHEM